MRFSAALDRRLLWSQVGFTAAFKGQANGLICPCKDETLFRVRSSCGGQKEEVAYRQGIWNFVSMPFSLHADSYLKRYKAPSIAPKTKWESTTASGV
jgi:hypothetical protein